MNLPLIHTWSNDLKYATVVFILVLSVGFFSGISFVDKTSGFTANGVQENYLGNENDEEATVLKFKKNDKQLTSLIHSHILSMSAIFFMLSILVSATAIPSKLKRFLMIEPLLSVLFTFGGIYFLCNGQLWMKYIVILSGILMTLSYSTSIAVIFWQILKKSKV